MIVLGSRSFKQVVTTRGNDVTLTLSALRKMGNAFLTRIIVSLVALGLILIGLLVVLTIVLVNA